MQQKLFSNPVVCSSNPKDWYIYFRFYANGRWHDLKRREGLNRIKCFNQRKKEAASLAEARLIWLRAGWNPVLDPRFHLRNLVNEEGLQSMSFAKALDFALSKKDLAEKSYADYRNQLVHVKATAEKLGLHYLPVSKITRLHILQVLGGLRQHRKISNKTYNKYRDTLRSMFNTLETWLAVEYNPVTKIDDLRTTETHKFTPLDESEKIAITELLSRKYYHFFVYIQVLYHTGIRPKEILALQVSDIDLKKQVITIIPDLKRENSKTRTMRVVPLNDKLMTYLLGLNLHQYPSNYFVFGAKPSRLKKAPLQKIVDNNYFMPSLHSLTRDAVTKLWKQIVIDGLGIKKHLYALKHTGADDKIMAGIDLDALRHLYGHRSRYMTEVYARSVKDVYASQIKTLSPAFVSVLPAPVIQQQY